MHFSLPPLRVLTDLWKEGATGCKLSSEANLKGEKRKKHTRKSIFTCTSCWDTESFATREFIKRRSWLIACLTCKSIFSDWKLLSCQVFLSYWEVNPHISLSTTHHNFDPTKIFLLSATLNKFDLTNIFILLDFRFARFSRHFLVISCGLLFNCLVISCEQLSSTFWLSC